MAKEKFTSQYIIKSAPVPLLWNYISSDSGLEQWFADKVSHEQKHFVFEWNGSSQEATLLESRTYFYIKFRWAEDSSPCYWELRISVDELTDDTILTVTDFAEPDEIEDEQELWDSQIETLKRCIGC